MTTKTNARSVRHLKSRLFRKSLLASEADSKSFQTSKMELFANIAKNQKLFISFCKKPPSCFLTRF